MSARKRLKKKRKDQQGFVLIFLVICAVSLFSYFLYDLNQQVAVRDDVTMCRSDGVVSRETILLIDATDMLSTSQAMVIKKKVAMELEKSKLDERFSVYVLDENISSFNKSLTVCNPGDGSDKSELIANKRRLKKDWEEKFYGKIGTKIDNIISGDTSKTSPIMEMIKYASIDTMMDSKAQDKRVIIISDMLHHTNKYSHYKEIELSKTFLTSGYGLQVRPFLKGVELQLFYVNRSNASNIQNRGHIMFWEKYVQSGGGTLTSVEAIY